jgi:hypothetical protein
MIESGTTLVVRQMLDEAKADWFPRDKHKKKR